MLRMVVLLGLISSFATAAEAAEATVPPDIVVAADGSGQFTTVQEAVASIPRDNRERVIVLVKDGVYKEKIRVEADFVTLRGESRSGTRIEFSQLNDDYNPRSDRIGRAVINLDGDDFVLQNMTVANTAGVVGKHAFTIYGKPDRTVIVDCDLLSDGADTLSLWNGDGGRYYHARCHMRGAVDFVCPRGWCYITDCSFDETKTSAAMWHDGSKNQDQKFVLRNCQFDGVPGWELARHHHDGAFYFLHCTFSETMKDRAPYRVIYPLGSAPATEADSQRNRELDRTNIWGERRYFLDCHREGGDYDWIADNLSEAPGAPTDDSITAAWTFAGTWDPERVAGPILRIIRRADWKFSAPGNPEDMAIAGSFDPGQPPESMRRALRRGVDHFQLIFDEPVTVKGKLTLKLTHGRSAEYVGGSGTDTLVFDAGSDSADTEVAAIELGGGGAVIASRASATVRHADLAFPDQPPTIVLVGDSTVTEGSGWGIGFKKCLTINARCINAAQNGRSSKSYRDEGRWTPVLESGADFVLLQFGHNDQPGKGPERESPADTAYRANMTRYVTEARAAGMRPVLVTSLVRRRFDADGKIRSDLIEYVDVVKEVAAATDTPLVDLQALSIELCEELGPEECKTIEPVAGGKQDTTHLNAKGSALVGRLVAEELARVVPELAPHIRVGDDE